MLDAFSQAETVSNEISAFFGAGIISYYDEEDVCIYQSVGRSTKIVSNSKHEEEIEPNKKKKKKIYKEYNQSIDIEINENMSLTLN